MFLIDKKSIADTQDLDVGTDVLVLMGRKIATPEHPFAEGVWVKILFAPGGGYIGTILEAPVTIDEVKSDDCIYFEPEHVIDFIESDAICKVCQCEAQNTGD